MGLNQGRAGDATVLSLGGLDDHNTIDVSFSLGLQVIWDGLDGPNAPDSFKLVADEYWSKDNLKIAVSTVSPLLVVPLPAGGALLPSALALMTWRRRRDA